MNKLKLSKDDKRRRKQYRKDYKNAIKLLHQAIDKKYGPWDNFLKIIFPIILDHWKKYYSLGYDVYAYEIKDTPEHKEPTRPTRYEIACELEKLYTEWVQFPKYMDFFE